MYQVFVVEDELLIRQNIRRLVEKIGSPFSFCGEAADGEIALSIIQDVMPDILLTDIRMPFLDGFDLIRHAKTIMPWLKVVIISGFDDFEYARKAISLGVNSYLLKPVNAQDLTRELNKLAEEIEAEKQNGSVYDEDEIGSVLRQNFVKQVFSGTADTVKLLDKAGALKLDIVRTNYQVALFRLDSGSKGRRALNDALMALLAKQGIQTFIFTLSGTLAVLFCENSPKELSDRVYRFVSILKHELSPFCSTVTVVTSPIAERLSMVSGVYQTAFDLLQKACMVSPGQVIDAADTAQLAMSFLNLNEPFGESFRRKLAKASANDVESILDSAIHGNGEVKLDNAMTRFYALLQILKASADLIASGSNGMDAKDAAAKLNSGCDINAASADMNTFKLAALKLMRLAVGAKSERSASTKHYHVMNRAVAYVQANYCDPNISLISVANHVGMSTAHFSTVFSQAMGRSFISYLTMLRIEKAKELLVTTDMKLSDVAMEIGYNEPNYFSHVFRKSEGVTPKDYRNGITDNQ